MHTGGEPDGDNGKRADDGRLPAKQLLFCRLSDGGDTLYELRVSIADGGALDLSEAEKEIKISVVLAK